MNALLDFLRTLFSGFLTSRRTRYQFRRAALLDVLAQGASGKPDARGAIAAPVSRDMQAAASDNVTDALARMDSHVHGLTGAEVQARQAHFGANEVAHEKPLHWSAHLWHCYKNPFNLLLSALAAIRTWLRQHIPALRHLPLSDNELIRNYITPARAFVEQGRRHLSAAKQHHPFLI